ncbi:MAG: type II secretion system protein [Sedimentisphaerales bacterium]|nr:type II secretion system protein [Sedimentisphaerales bacterium]
MRNVQAFTLIELMVVIAIIAMMIGILLPAMQLARDQGYELVCRSTLRQYGIAQSVYLSDNDDYYPNPEFSLISDNEPEPEYQTYCRWHDKRYPPDGPLWPYLKDAKAHLCPKFNSLARTCGQNHPRHNPDIEVDPVFSYSMNAFLGMRRDDYANGMGVLRSTEITRNKSKVFFFSEENMWLRDGCKTVLNDNALWSNGNDWFGTFHNAQRSNLNSGTANAVFVDGHAESVRSALKNNQYDHSEKEFGLFEKYGWPRREPFRTSTNGS